MIRVLKKGISLRLFIYLFIFFRNFYTQDKSSCGEGRLSRSSRVFLKHYLVIVDKNGVGKRLSAIT